MGKRQIQIGREFTILSKVEKIEHIENEFIDGEHERDLKLWLTELVASNHPQEAYYQVVEVKLDTVVMGNSILFTYLVRFDIYKDGR